MTPNRPDPSWRDTAAGVYLALRPHEREQFHGATGIPHGLAPDLAVAFITNAAQAQPQVDRVDTWVTAHWDDTIDALRHQVGGTDLQVLRMLLTAALWTRITAGGDLNVTAVRGLAERAALVMTGATTYVVPTRRPVAQQQDA